MPHAASDITTDPILLYICHTIVYNPDGSEYTRYYSWQNVGTHKRVRRAASVNNPKDVFGWRSPSAYYFHRMSWSSNACMNENAEKVCGQHRKYPFGYLPVWPSWTWEWSDLTSPSFPTYTIDSIARATVRNKALIKLKDQKVNLSVALAESVKTYKMVRDTIMDLRRIALDLRRGRNPFRGPLFSKSIASRWLEVRYGWTPLVKDIGGTVAWLDKYLNGSRAGLRCSVGSSVTQSYPASRSNGITYCPAHTWVSNERADVRWKGRYYYKCEDDAYFLLNDLGYQDPLVIAWELVPYSFVIDWLIPVGNYLEGLFADTGMVYLAGTMTRAVKYDGYSVNNSSDASFHPGSVRLRSRDFFGFIRTLEAKPHATIVPNLNALRPSGTRIVDAISLLANALGSSRSLR